MTDARKASGLVQWLTQVGLPLLFAGGLLAGVLALGQHLGDRMKARGTASVYFVDLECDPPDGMARVEFLEQAQYLAGLPERLDALDPLTPQRIGRAFELHPWVARVTRVRLEPRGRGKVELVYREPVLAVAKPEREVDAAGVLLPRTARRKGLPTLTTVVSPPRGQPGEPWGDVRVGAVAKVAELLLPHLERRGLGGCSMEIDAGEVTLVWPRGRVLWGRPPGLERSNEAAAGVKADRLPEAAKLAGLEYDVRPAAAAKQRPLDR